MREHFFAWPSISARPPGLSSSASASAASAMDLDPELAKYSDRFLPGYERRCRLYTFEVLLS